MTWWSLFIQTLSSCYTTSWDSTDISIMISENKLEANRENAKSSTGPRDTSRTRLNSLKHGILSKVALITFGEGPEDLEAFQELSSSHRQDLAPAGALEEFLVDLVITEAWRWRRVIRYEST